MKHSVKFMTFLKLSAIWLNSMNFPGFLWPWEPCTQWLHQKCEDATHTPKVIQANLKDSWSILNETPTNLHALVFNLLWIWLLPERLLTAYDTRTITSLSNDRTEKMARTRRTSTIILFIYFFLYLYFIWRHFFGSKQPHLFGIYGKGYKCWYSSWNILFW